MSSRSIISLLFFCGTMLSLPSCNVTHYLKDDEQLLKGNDIKFLGKEKIENKRTLKYELSTLLKQKENTKFFFTPREWFWYATQDANDTTAIDRFQRRVIAEPPSIYNDSLTKQTEKSMKFYLQYKGYYKPNVFSIPRNRGKKIYITYYVEPHQRYFIDSVFYYSADTAINSILQDIKKQSVLKRGNGLDLSLYEQDKERITKYLRNHGYAFFYSNNFAEPLEVDTTQHPPKANIYIEISPPFGESAHISYTVGEVSVFPDYDPLQQEQQLLDTLIQGYVFRSSKHTYKVKPQTIIDGIYLKPGELFSQEEFDKTNRQLSALGIFRFVRIRQEVDSLRPRQLNFRVELTPNYKMELGTDFEVNYTNRSGSAATGNLLGLVVNPSLRNRNLFRGAELLVTNFSAGVEVNPTFSDARFWNTVDLRIQTDLYFPKFLDYLGFWHSMHEIPWGKKGRLINESFYQKLRESAATRLSSSYNFLLVLGWYRYNLFNASYGYDLKRSNTTRYIINHFGVDYLRPITEPAFDSLLSFNPFLERSFGEQFFVSLLFRDFNFVFNSRPNRYGESYYAGISAEMAGAEIWGVNAIYNEFALAPKVFRLGKSDFSQYAKLELDGRYYRQYSPKHSAAVRFDIALVRPFGYTTDVPYVKQLYVGGPNSIRAWAPRGLGPGGYFDPLALDPRNNIRLYQSGDLKLEFNAEYRFDIFWRLKGALFLDAGNIWTLKRDTNRVGSQFTLRRIVYYGADCENGDCINDPFYKQIAIGGGFGLRIDFTYFIFRTDMGVKLRNSYPRDRIGVVTEGDYWADFRGFGLRDIAFNLGFGYPF